MKNPLDPRHLKRIKLLEKLFSWEFSESIPKDQDLKKIIEHLSLIDEKIAGCAPQWSLDKMAKIDLAILRLATYELAVVRKEPYKVVIDEAIELAKYYGSDKSANLINGVMGAIYQKL